MIRLSKSCLSALEKKAVMKILDREFLGMGKEVKLFEENLSNFFNCKATCVVNGTAALQLAIQSVNISNGDEVLVPSLTYVSNFQSITANSAIPIPCDIDPDTLVIDVKDAEKKITKKTKAIMTVHYAGGVGDLEGIYNFAKKNNLRVIEDASHAFGTIYNNNLVGAIGDIVCFSFDGIKNITSGEGGCVVTSDINVIEKIKDIRLLGVHKDTEKRFYDQRSWEFDVKDQGWRYHMSDIMASIGNIQLSRFADFAKKRKYIAKNYDNLFVDNLLVKIFNKNYDNVVPHIYPIRVLNLKKRDLLRAEMLEKGIETGVHYYPNHYLSFFKNSNMQYKLTNTDEIYPELLTLPIHPDIGEEDVNYIAETLLKIIPKYNF